MRIILPGVASHEKPPRRVVAAFDEEAILMHPRLGIRSRRVSAVLAPLTRFMARLEAEVLAKERQKIQFVNDLQPPVAGAGDARPSAAQNFSPLWGEAGHRPVNICL